MTNRESIAMIQALRLPAAYPHRVGAVELIETHISWVLLTGEFAYKIKKPVDLGFVDFTTIERRKFFCEEELRLNCRLAPELYLDVLPVTGSPEAPRINGRGNAFEYCVRMKQFDQDCLLSRVVLTDRIRAQHIDALARQVFEFHSRVSVADLGSRFGTPAAVAEPIRANFTHLDLSANEGEQNLIARLKAWFECELDNLHDQLAARKQNGFIRECHGDMHLGNMILVEDAITIFDCIEFNEDLRWIDVLSEVAFCTMDLEDRGQCDLAQRFLNSYLEMSGDYKGLAAFRLYLAYRAVVRAKVTALRRNDSQLKGNQITRLNAELLKYVELADAYTCDESCFMAITHGVSGSGKTWATQTLLENSRAIRVRSDIERKRLAGLSGSAQSGAAIDGGIYADDFSVRTYDKLADLASAIIAAGFPAIVDATFLKRSERHRFQKLAQKLGVRFVILDFPTDEATCRQRIHRRALAGTDASEATEVVLDQQLHVDEPLTDEERTYTLQIDSKHADWIDHVLTELADRS